MLDCVDARSINIGRGVSQKFRPLLQQTRVQTRRTKVCRPTAVAPFDFFRKKIASSGAVDDILSAVESTERGCNTSRSSRAKIDAALGVLEGAGDSTSFNKTLSATWKLLWTTEKETLFILKNAGLFRTTAGDVFQVIDTDNSTLQNVITFPPDGAFKVESKIELSAEQRITFEFVGASLKLPRRELKLPPYGKGWFDTVYLDSRIRVSTDSRGDTLIVARDGPPRSVT